MKMKWRKCYQNISVMKCISVINERWIMYSVMWNEKYVWRDEKIIKWQWHSINKMVKWNESKIICEIND